MTKSTLPDKNLGFGLGLRASHYPHIFEQKPAVDWFEIISENFMDTDGKPRRNLARIKEQYPLVMHGVSMSIGTVDPINSEYLRKLKALIDWANPAWVSDHLCWTGVAHKNTHDLLPLPYTEESLKHIVQRIKQVQDYLERPITLENPSTYLEFKSSTMLEAEFISHMAEESGCNLLLDVNNVYVTCYNHRLDPKAYLDALPLDRVMQIHLSGHSNKGTHIIDTHDHPVIDEVWNLYKYVVHKSGRVPNTMVEWDDNIPEFPMLMAELEKARVAAASCAQHTLPTLAQEQVPQLANQQIALAPTQQHMQEAIFLGELHDSQPNTWIRAKEQFSPQQQLDVYINAFRFRLYDTTAMDYPVLRHYLGKDAFHSLIWGFANAEKPDHFNIARFTLKLPVYVAKQMPDDIFAQELCQLETIIAQLADPAETQALTTDHLTGLTPETLMECTLQPRKALMLCQFSYPVNDYYLAVMEERQPEKPAPKASHLAVFRHEDTIWRMELGADEYQLLAKLFNNMPIGKALEELDESVAQQLTTWFSRWIRNGLLAAPLLRQSEGETTHEAA